MSCNPVVGKRDVHPLVVNLYSDMQTLLADFSVILQSLLESNILLIMEGGTPYKMIGETPEVRSDKGKQQWQKWQQL